MPQVTQDPPCTLHHYSFMWLLCNMRIFNNFELMDNCTLNKRSGQDVVHHHYCTCILDQVTNFKHQNLINSHTNQSAQDLLFMQQTEVSHPTRNKVEAQSGVLSSETGKGHQLKFILWHKQKSQIHLLVKEITVSQTSITSKKAHKIHSPQLRDLPFEILFQNGGGAWLLDPWLSNNSEAQPLKGS